MDHIFAIILRYQKTKLSNRIKTGNHNDIKIYVIQFKCWNLLHGKSQQIIYQSIKELHCYSRSCTQVFPTPRLHSPTISTTQISQCAKENEIKSLPDTMTKYYKRTREASKNNDCSLFSWLVTCFFLVASLNSISSSDDDLLLL